MHSQLSIEVGEGVKGVGVVEAALTLAVAAFRLVVMAGRIRANQLVADTQFRGCLFKVRNKVAVGLGETVGECEPVVCLNALYHESALLEKSVGFLQEIGGGVGALLVISSEVAQTRELVDSRVLIVALVACAAGTGNHLDVDSNMGERYNLLQGIREAFLYSYAIIGLFSGKIIA